MDDAGHRSFTKWFEIVRSSVLKLEVTLSSVSARLTGKVVVGAKQAPSTLRLSEVEESAIEDTLLHTGSNPLDITRR